MKLGISPSFFLFKKPVTIQKHYANVAQFTFKKFAHVAQSVEQLHGKE